MIELKLTFATYEEAAEFLLARSGSPAETTTATISETVVAVPTETKATAEKAPAAKKTTAKKEEPKVEEKPAGEAPAMTEDEAADYFKTQVRPALSRYMAKHGQDAARQFLLDYAGLQTKALSSLPVEHYVAFVAACDEKAAA